MGVGLGEQDSGRDQGRGSLVREKGAVECKARAQREASRGDSFSAKEKPFRNVRKTHHGCRSHSCKMMAAVRRERLEKKGWGQDHMFKRGKSEVKIEQSLYWESSQRT